MEAQNRQPSAQIASGAFDSQLQQAYRWLDTGNIGRAQAEFAQLRQEPAAAADALNGLGLCAEAVRDLSGAEAAYRQAIGLREAPEFLNNLAICLQAQGRGEEALKVMQRLAVRMPTDAIGFNLAAMQARHGHYWEALVTVTGLLSGESRLAEPALLLLELLKPLVYQPDTLERLQAELARNPQAAGWHLALAVWYETKGQAETAVRFFRSALRLNPNLLMIYRQLIYSLQSKGLASQALAMARELFTHELTPQSLLELLLVLQEPIPASEAQSRATRAEYESLLALRETPGMAQGQLNLSRIPFYLVYQGGNDRPLQEKLAAFLAPFVQRPLEQPLERPIQQPNSTPGRSQARPRLGLVSLHLCQHSVLHVLQSGIETLLGAAAFETWILLCPLGRRDEVTETISARADHVLELPDSLPQALERIAGLGLDLLVFTDIGLDAYTYGLAMNRLARFQIVLPGHPITTGMPTIDYYLSTAGLESANSAAFYTETLVRLPGLPGYAQPELPPPAGRAELGLPEARNLYFCPMTLFKLQPAFDEILARILAADPNGEVLLLENKAPFQARLQARFASRFPALAPRLRFLGWSNQAVFFQRLMAADVILDSFPFGGGNTSYQALGLGCPIVCLDQPWQKGRWTQAMYHLMQMPELIAADESAYIALAVRIASQKSLQLRQQIRARSRILFANPTWAQALLAFCQNLATEDPRA